MEAPGFESNEPVALANARPVENPLLLDDTDDRPGDVVVARLIKARHLRRLAAEKREPELPAGFRHSRDHRRGDVGIELPHGEVVEEKERVRPLDQDVVDAVGDEVVADTLVPTRRNRDLELGSDAVGRSHQDRPEVARRVEPKESPEASDVREHFGTKGRASELPDFPDGAAGGVDVDSRGTVIHGRLL